MLIRALLLALFLVLPFSVQAVPPFAQTVFIPYCEGTNDTARFTALISTIGANEGTIQLPYKSNSAQRCAVNNLTVPANIVLSNANGSGIRVNSGQELVLQAHPVGPIKQFFYNALAGQGTVSFSGNRSLGRLYPQWWGATGNGTTDDRLPIQAAMTASGTVSGGNVHFIATANGYLVTGSVRPAANTTISGDGYGSLIKCPDAGWLLVAVTNIGIVNIDNKSNVRITNLRIRGTKLAPAVPEDGGNPQNSNTPKLIYMEGTGGANVQDGVIIDHCWLENSKWEGIWMGGSVNSILRVQINDNQFRDIEGPAAVTGTFRQGTISNNVFKDCRDAIGTTGSLMAIVGNQIYNATSQGINIGEIGNSGFFIIAGNMIHIDPGPTLNWVGIGAHLVNGTDGAVNIAGNTVFVENSEGAASGAAIKISGTGWADVNNNFVQGNGTLYGVSAAMTGTSKVSVRGNTMLLTSESSTGNSSRGVTATISSGTLNLQSTNNKVFGMTRANGNYAYDYRATGSGTIMATLSGDIKAEGHMNVAGKIYQTSEHDNVPIFLSSDNTSNSAFIEHVMLGMLRFRDVNSFAIASGAISIAGIGGSSGLPHRQTRIAIDTEGGAATDDLDTINGPQDGDVLIIQSTADARDPTIKNGTGNILCGSDFTLATVRDRITLLFDGSTSKWVQISRSTN